MFRIGLRAGPSVGACTAIFSLGVFYSSYSSSSAAPSENSEDQVYQIAQRLKAGLSPPNLRLRKDYGESGLKSFSVRTKAAAGFTFGKDGYPICRVGTIEISSNLDEIVQCLEDPTMRQHYDPNCAESRAVKSSTKNELAYMRGKAGFIIPARDFCFERVKLSPAIMGVNNFQGVVILLKDASGKVPSSWRAFRGKANACFVLEPINSSRVLLTYLNELDPGGYSSWLDRATVDFLVGDSSLLFLRQLKSFLESKGKENEKLSIDEAARLRFQQLQKQAASASVLDDLDVAGVSAEHLKETVRLLELQLVSVKRQEKAENLDLTALKEKIQTDLISTKQKLIQKRGR